MIPPHKTWIELNAKVLHENVINLNSVLTKNTSFNAVVKANAYGHGLDEIVRLLVIENIENFSVDSVNEAMLVRKKTKKADIFILGYTTPERLIDVVKNDLIQTVYDIETLHLLAKIGLELSKKVKINLKIETGLNRQGVKIEKLDSFLREIIRLNKDIELTGISSHFADAENISNHDLSNYQIENFYNALDTVERLNFKPKYIHMACSAAAISRIDSHFSMSRFGISLYGLWSSEEVKNINNTKKEPINLMPVLAWKTKIAQVKDIKSGEYIGYSRKYITDHPIRIAILPVGYYDGYSRILSNKADVLIKGRRCPVISTVCMNMCFIDVSQVPNVSVNDTVTLLGRDGMNEITADELAIASNTINYEIVTKINPLIPRIIV